MNILDIEQFFICEQLDLDNWNQAKRQTIWSENVGFSLPWELFQLNIVKIDFLTILGSVVQATYQEKTSEVGLDFEGHW